MTTTELIRDVYKIASEIKKQGFQPGDVISCLVYSEVHYYSFMIATWMSGCVLSSLQHSFSQGMIKKLQYSMFWSKSNQISIELLIKLLQKSRSRLLLCDQKSAARCLAVKNECLDLEKIYVLGEFAGCIPYNDLLTQGQALSRG